nr:probable 5-hydroxyisourate hydrolase R09H10.3 [Aedes albopictus]
MGVSVEVFDISLKKPAVNLKVSFCRALNIAPNGVVMSWEKIDEGQIDSNGHYRALASADQQQTPLATGQYKLVFKVGQHYERMGTKTPHLYDEIVFEITDASQDTHYKLTISPSTGLVQAK